MNIELFIPTDNNATVRSDLAWALLDRGIGKVKDTWKNHWLFYNVEFNDGMYEMLKLETHCDFTWRELHGCE